MTAGTYYNEWDPYAADWLRRLIAAGHLPAGDVDERSITEVGADDLRGYAQCHFFAGIGGWAYALRLAGVPDDFAVWTGSCPCQPFSAAGKRRGVADERHLWPEFRRLIAECNPPVVFGEQVASKDGRLWLAGVRTDLEALGYAVGAADLCAAGVGAPHIRQRLWWVAESSGERRERRQGAAQGGISDREDAGWIEGDDGALGVRQGGGGRPADAAGGLAGHGDLQPGGEHGQQPQDGGTGERLADATDGGREPRPGQHGIQASQGRNDAISESGVDGNHGGLADAERNTGRTGGSCQQPGGSVEAPGAGPHAEPGRRGDAGGLGDADDTGSQGRLGAVGAERPGERAAGETGASFWGKAEWLDCADGRARRVEPGIFPLAHGVSFKLGSGSALEGKSRVNMLRAAGNAIVPQVAAQFIEAYMRCRP